MKAKYVVGVVLGVAVLLFGYYAISPLFRNVAMNDAVPAGSTQSASAQVVGTTGHPASGSVRVVTAENKRYIRYEDFSTINGPDIYVYLAKDLDAKEFVSLGKVKATSGNVNYEIPAGVDPSEYPYVLTWCKAFSVLFNHADLSQAF